MDEKSLILSAIRNKDSVPDIEFPGEDAILDLVKKRKRKESFKGKSCFQWNNADFLRYIDYVLKNFGVSRNFGSTRKEADLINHLYDRFAKKHETMNNMVLRDYIDWWCSIHAPRLTGKGFYLYDLMDDQIIDKFMSRYAPEEEKEEVSTSSVITAADRSIFDLGGLPLLVVKRGAIIGYSIARESIAEPQKALESVLRALSVDMLRQIMSVTMANNPRTTEFDFISFVSPILEEKGIKDYFREVKKDKYGA